MYICLYVINLFSVYFHSAGRGSKCLNVGSKLKCFSFSNIFTYPTRKPNFSDNSHVTVTPNGFLFGANEFVIPKTITTEL